MIVVVIHKYRISVARLVQLKLGPAHFGVRVEMTFVAQPDPFQLPTETLGLSTIPAMFDRLKKYWNQQRVKVRAEALVLATPAVAKSFAMLPSNRAYKRNPLCLG